MEPLVTVVTSFKPFIGEDSVRQINCLRACASLWPGLEVIALNKPEDFRSVDLAEFRIKVVSEFITKSSRLPRIDLALKEIDARGLHDILVYINGDILLPPSLVPALSNCFRFDRFVAVAQRIDVELSRLLCAEEIIDANFWNKLLASGELHDPGGIDFFAFRRGSVPEMPQLYVGAAGWDNITIYSARRQKIPVIDVSSVVCVGHQNHEYIRDSQGGRFAYVGEEARLNLSHVANRHCLFTVLDANYTLQGTRIISCWTSWQRAWKMVGGQVHLRRLPRAASIGIRCASWMLRQISAGLSIIVAKR